MSITQQLRQQAQEMAERLSTHSRELERELAEIEKQKVEIEAKCNDARLAPQRLANYPVKLGNDYLCPVCWVESGRRSPLYPIDSETSDDILRCRFCQSEFSFSL